MRYEQHNMGRRERKRALRHTHISCDTLPRVSCRICMRHRSLARHGISWRSMTGSGIMTRRRHLRPHRRRVGLTEVLQQQPRAARRHLGSSCSRPFRHCRAHAHTATVSHLRRAQSRPMTRQPGSVQAPRPRLHLGCCRQRCVAAHEPPVAFFRSDGWQDRFRVPSQQQRAWRAPQQRAQRAARKRRPPLLPCPLPLPHPEA